MKIKIAILFVIILIPGVYSSEIAKIFDGELRGDKAASSFLIEKGISYDNYSPKKAFDGNKDTCWCEGAKDDGVGQFIWFGMTDGRILYYKEYKDLKITLEIENGVSKNENLFKKNNRIKKAIIEIYETHLRVSHGGVFRDNEPKLNSSIEIELKDEIIPQTLVLKIKPKFQPEGSEYTSFSLMAKLIIKEIYKGEKYSDTCLSEIKVHPID